MPGDESNPQDVAAEQPARMYSEQELEQRLRGQAKELAKAKDAMAELENLKAQQAERDRKAAEKRGEFEQLHTAEKSRADELESKLGGVQGELEKLRGLLANEVESAVKNIEDNDRRKRLESLLDGRDVLDQRAILSAFLVDSAQQVPEPKNHGQPNRPRPS